MSLFEMSPAPSTPPHPHPSQSRSCSQRTSCSRAILDSPWCSSSRFWFPNTFFPRGPGFTVTAVTKKSRMVTGQILKSKFEFKFSKKRNLTDMRRSGILPFSPVCGNPVTCSNIGATFFIINMKIFSRTVRIIDKKNMRVWELEPATSGKNSKFLPSLYVQDERKVRINVI